MNTGMLFEEIKMVEEIIQQAETLKRQIEVNHTAPSNALGGKMLSAFNEVRDYQLNIANNICNQLYALLTFVKRVCD